MAGTSTMKLGEAIDRAVAELDFNLLHKKYWEQNEFLVLESFLPRTLVEEWLVPAVTRVKPDLNRNYIPGHKKGGSVSYYTVRNHVQHVLGKMGVHSTLEAVALYLLSQSQDSDL